MRSTLITTIVLAATVLAGAATEWVRSTWVVMASRLSPMRPPASSIRGRSATIVRASKIRMGKEDRRRIVSIFEIRAHNAPPRVPPRRLGPSQPGTGAAQDDTPLNRAPDSVPEPLLARFVLNPAEDPVAAL